MSYGDSGNLSDLDWSTLQRYLPDVTFPASKEEVASVAESNGAPQDLVRLLRGASVERFISLGAVLDYLILPKTPRERRAPGKRREGKRREGKRREGSPRQPPITEDSMPGDWTGGGPDDL